MIKFWRQNQCKKNRLFDRVMIIFRRNLKVNKLKIELPHPLLNILLLLSIYGAFSNLIYDKTRHILIDSYENSKKSHEKGLVRMPTLTSNINHATLFNLVKLLD